MKLIHRYIDNFPTMGGYCYLDNDIKGKLIKNVKYLSFSNMYIRIILMFYKNGIINIPEIDAKDIEYILNLDKIDTGSLVFINSYFGKLHYDERIKISNYGYLMCNDIIKNNNNIVYIDTDSIFYIGDNIDLLDIDMPFSIKKMDYIIFDNTKKYIYYNKNTNEFKTNGLNYNSEKMYNRVNEYLSLIKKEIRNDKLGKFYYDKLVYRFNQNGSAILGSS